MRIFSTRIMMIQNRKASEHVTLSKNEHTALGGRGNFGSLNILKRNEIGQ
jgi:hypothetical protein